MCASVHPVGGGADIIVQGDRVQERGWYSARVIRFGHRVFVPLVFCLGLIAQIAIYDKGLAHDPIRSDGVSYYVYLPAIVLHQSPRLWALANEEYGGAFPPWTSITRWTRSGGAGWLNPHPIGEAVLMLPFFLAAHLLTRWSNLPPDGFSLYYQQAASLAGLFYGVLGLEILRRALLRYFTRGVVLAALIAIALGTNLFHYMTYDAVYSHVYAFFLVCVLVFLIPRWYDSPSTARSLGLGITCGLLVITRHTHGILLLLPALYDVGVNVSVRERIQFLLQHARALGIVIASAFVVVVPQLLIYYAVTGHWLVTGYDQQETFHFDRPHFFGVLFSVQKGVFFWSPLLLIAMLGFFVMPRTVRAFRWPSLMVLAVITWLIASWFDWQFGGSYGHRGFTDVLPLFALALASACAWLAARPVGIRAVGVAAIVLTTSLSVVQMLQYWLGIVPIVDTTWEQYRQLFLNFQ